MTIVKRDDLIHNIFDYDVILVATSTKNSLYNGFQRQIAVSFPFVQDANNKTQYDDNNKLGTCQVATRGGYPTFILCYITTGRFRPDIKPDAVNYKALENCLKLISDNFGDKKIGTTILGSDIFEGGGDREKCLGLIEKYLGDSDVDVYDYEQKSRQEMDQGDFLETLRLKKEGLISNEEYYKRKCVDLWHRTHGYYEPMPDLSYKQLKNLIDNEKNNVQ